MNELSDINMDELSVNSYDLDTWSNSSYVLLTSNFAEGNIFDYITLK